MEASDDEHPVLREFRERRNYGDEVSLTDIYKAEASRMALLDPHKRASDISDFDALVVRREAQAPHPVGLRQKAQAWRLRQNLVHAHTQLKKIGR
jgi:hypothetical protein